MGHEAFGDELRRLREARGLSIRQLAKLIPCDPGTLSRIESGKRRAGSALAVAADKVLNTHTLTLLVPSDDHGKSNGSAQVTDAARSSMDFSRWAAADHVDPMTLEHLAYEITRIAIDYVHAPLLPLFHDLVELRDCGIELLQSRPHPNQARELFFLVGTVCTLLAHASQNLGDAVAGMAQARTAAICADQADHNGLRAWVAGTQALIAEWTRRPVDAVEFAERGQVHAATIESSIRLGAIEARALARLGDKSRALVVLDRTRRQVDAQQSDDEFQRFGGVLTFPATKALYYAGSTLGLVGEHERAERAALEAIAAYESGPAEARSYGDEALARVDVAAARVARGDLEGAADALRPVLVLPPEQRIRQIGDGLRALRGALMAPSYAKTLVASEIVDEINSFERPLPSHGALPSS